MVKDEDVCVHCGLCAERCPTAAWDMQKFDLKIPHAGNGATVTSGQTVTQLETRAPAERRDRSQRRGSADVRINDFALKLANVNGTGSASANGLLMQAIFRMGIPVSGKNLFPSNIQGLPTWYEIRVNKNGHVPRALDYDLMVAMNAETYARDVKEVRSGGCLLYDSTWPLDAALSRADVTFLGVPLAQMCNEIFKELARADPDEEHRLPRRAGRRCSTSTWTSSTSCSTRSSPRRRRCASRTTRRCAPATTTRRSTSTARCRSGSRRWTRPTTRILIDGNTATALGCVYAGATVAAWYPITPSTSVMDAFKEFCEQYRRDPETGKNNYCILQAEDELAAIGMVIGASLERRARVHVDVGPRHLADERADRPRVLRRDPGGDRRRAAHRPVDRDADAHAAGRHHARAPTRRTATPSTSCSSRRTRRSASRSRSQAFDLAERFQTPVFMLSDLDIGMNDWVVPALQVGRRVPPRPRPRAHAPPSWRRCPKFHRYSNEDDDHVAARTLPGVHSKGAFFTRGSGHNKFGGYTEIPDEYQEVMDRLARKHQAAAEAVPAAGDPHADRRDASASSPSAAATPRCARRSRRSPSAASSPTTCASAPSRSATTVETFLAAHDRIFVVEQNRDAQLRSLLTLETGGRQGQAALDPRLRRLPAVEPRTWSTASTSSAGAERADAATPRSRSSPTRTSQPNKLGLTLRDYEGAMSTLCAGCGHDSVTAAIVRAFYELDTPPHMIAKLSGIGCSSKTPTYFVSGRARLQLGARAHARRSRPAPPPPTATLTYIGISGDGDSLSIGLGQLCHAIRRNVNMLYVIENNGVYGLTKGQFSASADVGLEEQARRGEPVQRPIDPVTLALDLGRDVRRAQLLGRQGAARADPEGGARRTAASR